MAEERRRTAIIRAFCHSCGRVTSQTIVPIRSEGDGLRCAACKHVAPRYATLKRPWAGH